MTASHGNLNFTVMWLGCVAVARHKTKPRPFPRSGFLVSASMAHYFNKPSLCSGDDAATKPACVQKNAQSNACRHQGRTEKSNGLIA